MPDEKKTAVAQASLKSLKDIKVIVEPKKNSKADRTQAIVFHVKGMKKGKGLDDFKKNTLRRLRSYPSLARYTNATEEQMKLLLGLSKEDFDKIK